MNAYTRGNPASRLRHLRTEGITVHKGNLLLAVMALASLLAVIGGGLVDGH